MTPDTPLTSAWLEKHDGQKLPLTGNLSIGRTSTNQLVVEDQRVSRRHALIHVQGVEYWLVDLGSRNGTCVGERRIYQPVRLRDGDCIRICSQAFTFRQPGAERSLAALTQSAICTPTEIIAAQCWLLVADVEGSTRLAQDLPPDRLALLLGQWFQGCHALIEEHRGCINKYLGDGFLAFWREPGLEVNWILGAVQALHKLQKQAAPGFRFVAHRGEVLFNSAIPSAEENLSGPAMSFVFRMEKLASSLKRQTLFSQSAADALAGHLDLVPAGRHRLLGFGDRLAFFALDRNE